MRIKIRYLGLVKNYTQKNQEEIELNEGTRIFELLDKLASKFDEKFIKEVYNPSTKELKTAFVVLANGILINQLEGLQTKLKEKDDIILMPLMTGG